jgi:opacity protein-like surface antigen
MMRRCGAMAAAVLTVTLLVAGPAAAAEKGKLELGFLGALSFSQIRGTTAYEAAWGSGYLSVVHERTTIEMFPGLGLTADAFLTYYLGRTLGLQFLGGVSHARADSTSTFNLNWTWTSGATGEMEQGWDRAGGITTIPLSFNLAARIGSGKVQGAISGGPTLFHHAFKADTLFGYGVTRIDTEVIDQNVSITQYVDGLDVKLTIPSTSWWALGFDLGAGLNIEVNEGLAIRLEARYFFSPSKTLTWQYVYGTYNGIFFGDIQGVPFGKAEADGLAASNKKFELTATPSYFQVGLGVVFRLGS